MILIENRNYLRINNRPLLEKLSQLELIDRNQNVIIEQSKKGVPTIKLVIDGRAQYVHSKYDPEKEAEKLVDQIEGVEGYTHILFIGVGLGYHIKEILSRYPEMSFSIFEPDMAVLYHFLSHYDLEELSKGKLRTFITSKNKKEIQEEISSLSNMYGSQTLVYTLPSIAKYYAKEEIVVLETLKEQLKGKQNYLATNVSFQKRWTINSIKNFIKVLGTPNVLHDIDKEAFKGKPAIIVAAGPSLNEEFENLKIIKEQGLAYIFSVGSAINALIEHDIYPDATCTYDPTEQNQFVIQKVKSNNIEDIPLIFGSTVGFETIKNYPGKLLHMITSQDTISPRLLDTSQNIDIVLDAPSIAVVTFQLLTQLQCNLVILVGQNLGYRNNERYASGIQYDFINNNLSEQEVSNVLKVKDVYGNEIETSDGFNRMRQQLEMYIGNSGNIQVINTTNGGAHIEGTDFMPLSQVILEKLNINVVQKDWYEAKNSYDLEFVEKQFYRVLHEKERCTRIFNDLLNEIRIIENAVRNYQTSKLETRFAKFDEEFRKLKSNLFYGGFIEPMIRVQNEVLAEESQKLRFEKNIINKGRMVVDSFKRFINDCIAHHQFVIPYLEGLHEEFIQLKNGESRNKHEHK